jgi:hypothetical protein
MCVGTSALLLFLALPPAPAPAPAPDAETRPATAADVPEAQAFRFAGTRWGASMEETRATLSQHGFSLAPESDGRQLIFSGLLDDQPAIVVALFGEDGLTKILVSVPTKDETALATYREWRERFGLQYGRPELDVESYAYPFGNGKHVGYEAAALRVGKATIGALWTTQGEALGIKITDHLIVSAHYESPAWRLESDKRRD